jgi:hypothetical protein
MPLKVLRRKTVSAATGRRLRRNGQAAAQTLPTRLAALAIQSTADGPAPIAQQSQRARPSFTGALAALYIRKGPGAPSSRAQLGPLLQVAAAELRSEGTVGQKSSRRNSQKYRGLGRTDSRQTPGRTRTGRTRRREVFYCPVRQRRILICRPSAIPRSSIPASSLTCTNIERCSARPIRVRMVATAGSFLWPGR